MLGLADVIDSHQRILDAVAAGDADAAAQLSRAHVEGARYRLPGHHDSTHAVAGGAEEVLSAHDEPSFVAEQHWEHVASAEHPAAVGSLKQVGVERIQASDAAPLADARVKVGARGLALDHDNRVTVLLELCGHGSHPCSWCTSRESSRND